MRGVTMVQQSLAAVAAWLAGAAVGFYAPWGTLFVLGFGPGVAVGIGLSVAGMYLSWRIQAVAAAAGVYVGATVSTLLLITLHQAFSALD